MRGSQKPMRQWYHGVRLHFQLDSLELDGILKENE